MSRIGWLIEYLRQIKEKKEKKVQTFFLGESPDIFFFLDVSSDIFVERRWMLKMSGLFDYLRAEKLKGEKTKRKKPSKP